MRVHVGGMKDRSGRVVVEEYYALLDVIPCRDRPIPDHAYHNVLGEINGKMALKIHCLSKVYVGIGGYEIDDQGTLYQPFARRGDQLLIPGSCTKGVVRTYAEALSPSCEGGRCRRCICCSLFGALGFQGRVSFCDTRPLDPQGITEIFPLSVRWQSRLRKPEGRRFYFHNKPSSSCPRNPRTGQPLPEERVEVVREGTEFHLEMLFTNLSQEEIGLLLLAMGVAPDHHFDLKLGGGKNRRLGSVRFEVEEIQLLSKDQAYSSFDLGPDSGLRTVRLAEWGKEAVEAYLGWLRGLDEQWPQQALEAIQCFQSDPEAEE